MYLLRLYLLRLCLLRLCLFRLCLLRFYLLRFYLLRLYLLRLYLLRFYLLRLYLLRLYLLLVKRYNLYQVLAFSTTFFQLSLFCTTFFQLRTFMLFISSETSSSQRVLGLPIGLLDVGFHLLIFCTLLSSTVRSTWLNQFNLCFLINPIIQGDTKNRELLKNPTKIEEIPKKKNILTEIEPLQLAF